MARHKLVPSATKSAPASEAAAVQAEFAKAGISVQATRKILKQYKPYLNWDIETKLRPALQSWLQELGTEQLSQQLQKVRYLLVCVHAQGAQRGVLLAGVKRSECCKGTTEGTKSHDKGAQGSAEYLRGSSASSCLLRCTDVCPSPQAFCSS
ncbi:TPA: hypothetical protein ACH3X3_000035 [Trebouxia sp. C0006]